MASKGKGGASGGAKPPPVSRADRLEIMRQLILQGQSTNTIGRQFKSPAGMRLRDGRVIKVSTNTWRKDLDEIGHEWEGVTRHPAVLEARAGAALERIERLAIEASNVRRTVKGPDDTEIQVFDPTAARVALHANVQLIRVIGILSPRWRKGDDEERAHVGADEGDDLDALTDDELEERHRAAHTRAHRLQLVPDLPIEGDAVELRRRTS